MNRAPSTNERAFNCPHCQAYTSQTWFEFYATQIKGDRQLPPSFEPGRAEEFRAETDIKQELKDRLIEHFEKMDSGLVFLERLGDAAYLSAQVHNLHASQCFVCGKFAIWIHGTLVFPAASKAIPNEDLPEDIRRDFGEAARIVNESPRGAAALLRLAIQKLCKHLGGKGDRIDEDIGQLVAAGLSPTVQKALDAVRVIGNHAVHPGRLDLKDDVDTANSLFRLVNLIAEQMITNPRHVNEMYQKIPETTRQAIDERDKRK